MPASSPAPSTGRRDGAGLREGPVTGGAALGPAAVRVADWLAAQTTADYPLIVGVTGSVAVGKSTLSAALAQRLGRGRHVEVISTDGFLLSNEELAARGLTHRKGFPESYNAQLLSAVLQRARWGAVRVPGYSHAHYDIDPRLARTINRPEILLVEGLGLAPSPNMPSLSRHLDALIYIDASEEDLEAWFTERFMRLWEEAEQDPASFYAQFRTMTQPEALAFARRVWTAINIPNLRDHIVHARDVADIVIHKARDHTASVERIASRLRACV